MAYYHVTVAGASAKTGADWANAMGMAEFETSIEGGGAQAVAAGDIYFVAGGTYTFTANIICTTAGTATAPISVIGVKASTTNEGAAVVYADHAFGTDRPLFAGGAYYFGMNAIHHRAYNIRITSTATQAFITGAYAVAVNVKAENTSTGYGLLSNGGASQYISVEGISTGAGQGIRANGAACDYLYCWAHGPGSSGYCFVVNQYSVKLINCVVSGTGTKASIGIQAAAKYNIMALGCTVYNVSTGFNLTTTYASTFLNNIVDTCTTAFDATAAGYGNYYDYNNIYAETTKYGQADQQGPNDTAVDPAFTTPGTDFSLGVGSACIDAGLAMTLGVG
uniref:Pectate lyase n=1 Tax=viral metagenome TaxID=1070528 RepID=A0A6M3KFH0_9ZZZZ